MFLGDFWLGGNTHTSHDHHDFCERCPVPAIGSYAGEPCWRLWGLRAGAGRPYFEMNPVAFIIILYEKAVI
jgi:hypothetical protein